MTPNQEFIERVARAATAAGLDDVAYSYVDTAIGRLLVAQSHRGICRIAFQEEIDDEVLGEIADLLSPRVVRSESATDEARRQLSTYLEGASTRLDLPVDLSLTRSPWRRTVLNRLRRVARGKTVTYGELAQRSGSPRAARAVGSVCATNPVPIVVPCHRVLPTSGKVGNYGGGPEIKRWLLDLEGARHS